MSFLTATIVFSIALAQASPVPPIRNVEPINHQTPPDLNPPHTKWSRQDIFTLIGVFVAVIGILVCLLLASSKLRELSWKPFHCEL